MRTYGPKVADGSGNVNMTVRGRGFAIVPLQPFPLQYPIQVTPRNINSGQVIQVSGPDTFWIGEEFTGLDIIGCGSGQTFTVYIMDREEERPTFSVATTQQTGAAFTTSSQAGGATNAPTGNPHVVGSVLGNNSQGSLKVVGNYGRVVLISSGATMTGGNVQIWHWDEFVAAGGNPQWSRVANLRFALSATGFKSQAIDFKGGMNAGYYFAEADTVATIGGAGIVPYFEMGND